MTKIFFVYGTLKRGRGNHSLLSGAKFVGNGVTESDSFFMFTNGGFPYVLSNGKFHISGELFEVTDDVTEQRLDRLEGVPSHYVRMLTPIRVGDDVIDAEMYVASEHTAKYVKDQLRPIMPNDNNILTW